MGKQQSPKTRKCSHCGKRKRISQFYRNSRPSYGGSQRHCKKCSNVYYSRNYDKNPEYYKQNARRLQRQCRERIFEYKKTHPCKDCGNVDPRVLEFDHLKNKSFNISTMTKYSCSWRNIMKEISKCDVVCANCHKIRTYERRR